MHVTDRRILIVSYNGRQAKVPVYVVHNLNERAIAGMDLINSLGICYDPRVSDFISAVAEDPACPGNDVFTSSEVYLRPFEAKPIRMKIANWCPVDTIASVSVSTPDVPGLFANPGITTVFDNNKINYLLKNCSGVEVRLPRGYPMGQAEPISEVCSIDKKEFFDFDTQLPAPLPEDRRKILLNDININVPPHEKEAYVKLLLENHDVFSKDPGDLGSATNFEHSIMLKDFDPVYRKQFRIPEHHAEALQQQVKEWLKIGIIEPCHSRYNSSIFAVPKKGGKIRFVLDYRGLNDASMDDRYSMKDIHECIGDIGKAESTIFSTMDLTSGFWQLPLEKKSRPFTAFTVPGMGQYQYKVLAMGLKGGPGSFQRMMELTCKGLDKVIVYIDDLIVHTKNHSEHRQHLQSLFNRLRRYKLKLNLSKCFFGANNVSYLGYRLTPTGILPGSDKLLAIRNAKPPTSLSEVRAFLGLCNFFRSHVNRFATLASPLIRLTTKEAAWRGPNLPEDARQSFLALRDALISEPIVRYPKSSLPYELYCDASTGGAEFTGGYGAILAQRSRDDKVHVIAYASRALQKSEKNYTPFLAEMMCAVWAMNHFSVNLKGRRFKLFTDHKPLEKLSTTHSKTFNRLQEAMAEFDFELCYYPGSAMPADYLSRQFSGNVNAINVIGSLDFSSNDIQDAQSSDPFCIELRNYLSKGLFPSDNARATLIKRLAPLMVIKNGVLFRNHVDPVTDMITTLLVLPRSLIDEAVHRAHGTLLTGHGGIEKTKRRLLACYYWPNMDADIKDALMACPKCQKTTKDRGTKEVLHPLPQCSAPNQRLHMDLFGPLKTPTKAKAYIMCMTDAFTKYVEVTLIMDKMAETVSQAIFDNWICRYGLPLEIVTDGGKEFCNKVSADLFEKLRITHSVTSPAHPQCNAQAEVANKHFQKYLARMCENNTLHWEHLLPPMAFAYNTSVHSTTGLTPSFLLFGYNPLLPGLIPPSLEESENNNRLQALQQARDAAHMHSTKLSQQYKLAHDKKAKPNELVPGQQVLLDVRLFTNCNKKLAEKWEGPYFIYKVHPKGVIDILRNNKVHRVNVDRIKPFLAPPPGFQPIMPSSDPSDSEDGYSFPLLSDTQNPRPYATFVPPPPEFEPMEPTQSQPQPPPQRRGPGRPTKEEAMRKRQLAAQQPYSGPVTRSRSRSQSSSAPQGNQLSENSIMVSEDFKAALVNEKVRDELVGFAYKELLDKRPEVRGYRSAPVKPITIYYGDNQSRDEFGIPVTPETLDHPAYLRRRKYFESLDQKTRNLILTGDPEICFDPVFYEYIFTVPRPQVPPALSHLGEAMDIDPPSPPPPKGPPHMGPKRKNDTLSQVSGGGPPPQPPPPPTAPQPSKHANKSNRPGTDRKGPSPPPARPYSPPTAMQVDSDSDDSILIVHQPSGGGPPPQPPQNPAPLVRNVSLPTSMQIDSDSERSLSSNALTRSNSQGTLSTPSNSFGASSIYSKQSSSSSESLLPRSASNTPSYAEVARPKIPLVPSAAKRPPPSSITRTPAKKLNDTRSVVAKPMIRPEALVTTSPKKPFFNLPEICKRNDPLNSAGSDNSARTANTVPLSGSSKDSGLPPSANSESITRQPSSSVSMSSAYPSSSVSMSSAHSNSVAPSSVSMSSTYPDSTCSSHMSVTTDNTSWATAGSSNIDMSETESLLSRISTGATMTSGYPESSLGSTLSGQSTTSLESFNSKFSRDSEHSQSDDTLCESDISNKTIKTKTSLSSSGVFSQSSWSNLKHSDSSSSSLSSSSSSDTLNNTVIKAPGPLRSLKVRNDLLQAREDELATNGPMYDEVKAHALGPTMLPSTLDVTPPSFVPEDTNVLPKNVTPQWGDTDPIHVSEFEGRTVFTQRPIYPVPTPNADVLQLLTGDKDALREREDNFPEQFFADRTTESIISEGSIPPPLLPRCPIPPPLPKRVELRPAKFNLPEVKQPKLGFFEKFAQKELRKQEAKAMKEQQKAFRRGNS